MKAKKNKRKFNLADKIVLGLNILASICLLLSYLAPDTDPRDSILVAVLGFGYIYLALGTLIFIAYWLFRRPVLILITILPLLAGFSVITSFVGFRSKTPVPAMADSSNLRVMQYNVRKFEGFDKYEGEPVKKEVFEIINEKHPDLLTLVEYKKSRDSIDTFSDTLKNAVKLKYSYFQSFSGDRHTAVGNIIYSKYPIVKAGTVDSTFLLNTRAIYADILFRGKMVRVYSVHLAAVVINAKQKSKYLKGTMGINSVSFIGGRLSGAFITRSYQVALLKRHIETCPYPYIITGDLNDTPNSFAANELGDGLKSAFKEKGSGFETTYYSKFPLQIDYIFADKQFDILNYELVDKKLSDHKPLISDLKLK